MNLSLGTPAGALAPLERALSVRGAEAGDSVELAETRFALARALWDAGASRPRARELAELATNTYAAAGERAAAELAEVRAWQARHRR